MAYCLIVELKANIKDSYYSPAYVRVRGAEKRTHYPVSLLRYWKYPLDSEEYRIKKKIVEEFQRQGVDYWSEPIPADILKWMQDIYPDSWEEYIKRY